MNGREQRARAAIDAVHGKDPEQTAGRPAEAIYADQLESWVLRLVPQPGEELRLAARAQHLERWAIGRDRFPDGRGGYLRWRNAVHEHQGQQIRQILTESGYDAATATRVASLVAKTAPRDDSEAQALEDAACLVFLETELAAFAREHGHDKVVDVLRKTWKKMGPQGRELARTLPLSTEEQALLGAALAADRGI